jgi:pimeloyl-ACP methyl ester carboxylesterase
MLEKSVQAKPITVSRFVFVTGPLTVALVLLLSARDLRGSHISSTTPVSTIFQPTGIDFNPVTQKLIVTSGFPTVTQILAVDPASGMTSIFAPLDSLEEGKVAIAKGGACTFPVGDVFVAAGQGRIARFSSAGSPLGIISVSGATFFRGGLACDSVGLFGGDLIALDTMGKIFRISAGGSVGLFIDLQSSYAEGLAIAPLSFGPLGGQLIVGQEDSGTVQAVSPIGAVTTVISGFPGSLGRSVEDLSFVPASGGAFFIDQYGTNQVVKVDASSFTAFEGKLVVVTESPGSIYIVGFDDASGGFKVLDSNGAFPQFEQGAFMPAAPQVCQAPAFNTASLEINTTQLVDPIPDLADGYVITGDTRKLETGGKIVEGVAADSLTKLVVRMGAAKAGQNFKITLLNDKGKTSESALEDGGLEEIGSIRETFKSTLTVTSLFRANGPAVLLFIYHAPADFPRLSGEDAKSAERTVSLKIESADGSVCAGTTIKITRPPVMLVHGIWSEAAAWLEFCTLRPCKEQTPTGTGPGLALLNILVDNVQRQIFTVERAEYKATNFESFEKNAPLVLEQIRNYIKNFKARANVAAIQVDYVAHSMGGDIAQQIVITPGYKREIHKLITIDTPFLGSPFAAAFNRTGPFCKDAFAKAGNRVGGAVADLSENSAAIQKLKKKVIPIYAHVIAGVATKKQADTTIANAAANWVIEFCRPVFVAASDMYAAPSDLVVPKDSQLATGLGYFGQQFPAQSSPPNTVVDGIIHAVDTTLFTSGPDSLSHNLALQNGKTLVVGVNTPNPQHVIDRLNTPIYNDKVYTAIVP